MTARKDDDRCIAYTLSGGYDRPRKLRCQHVAGHLGQCVYRRAGGQGGSQIRWWGANPRPIGWIADLSHSELASEIQRLRTLCNDHQIDWLSGVPRITDDRAGR